MKHNSKKNKIQKGGVNAAAIGATIPIVILILAIIAFILYSVFFA